MGKMRLQTDREFQQTTIKRLNKEFDVDMYSTNLRGGKVFAAEQKICELKKLLLRSKCVQKSFSKRIKPNESMKKASFNLNNTKSAKYGFSREQIEEKSLNPERGQQFKETYDFSRLWRKKRSTRKVRKIRKKSWHTKKAKAT